MPTQHSRKDFALTVEQKMDARAALRILEGTGISLAAAARRAVEGQKAVKKITLQEAIDQFIEHKLNQQARPMTVEWYSDKLRRYGVMHGERIMDTISRAEIRGWVEGRAGVAANTKAAHARALRALWRWSIAHEPPLAGLDITMGMKTSSVRAKGLAGDITFLPVSCCSKIMHDAGPYRNALALMLFAGIRPGEVAGKQKAPLLWRHVRADEKIIRIPGEIAKVDGRGRILEGLPDAIWAWLEPGEDAEPICPALAHQAIERAKAAAGYGPKKPWPHDVLRHTFATYHVAMFNDPGKTSIILGH